MPDATQGSVDDEHYGHSGGSSHRSVPSGSRSTVSSKSLNIAISDPEKNDNVSPSASASSSKRRSYCQRKAHAFFVRKGYKFGDDACEQEYLSTVLYSQSNKIALTLVLIFFFLDICVRLQMELIASMEEDFSVLPFAVRFQFYGGIVLTALIGIFFVIAIGLYVTSTVEQNRAPAERRCRKCRTDQLTKAATAVALTAFAFFFQRNFWDGLYTIMQVNTTLQSSISVRPFVTVDQAFEIPLHCGAIEFSGTLDPIDTGGHRNKTSFAELSVASRLAGLLSTSNPELYHIICLWVGVKILVINNVLPAREFMAVIPVNGCLLVLMVFYMLRVSSANINGSVSKTFECIPLVWDLMVQSGFEYFIAVVGSCIALMQQMLIRARLRRELFFWTKKFQVKMAQLEREVDPFQLENLERWLENTEQRLGDQQVGTSGKEEESGSGRSVPDITQFWDIPEQQLRLLRKVASGAGGTVWQGKFKQTDVAAKQLFSLADRKNRDVGLRELANEVAILGKLDHPSIVRFLGLCRRDGLYGQDLKEAFIVQEWCAGNLRHVIEAHANSAGQTYHNPGHDVAFLGRYFAPISRVVRIALQLSQGMAYLHERGIVHRDLKPENVLLSVGDHPHVRICDFGISSSRSPLKKGGSSGGGGGPHDHSDVSRSPNSAATLRSSATSIRGLTSPFSSLSTVSSENSEFAQAVGASSRSVQDNGGRSSDQSASWDSDLKIGTIEYMPPEVYACFAKHADFRAQMQPPIDVYAFGLILWEILASRTGTTPPDSPNISPGVVVRKRMPFNRTRHRSRAKSLRMHTQVFRRPATQTKVSATTVGFEGVDNAATAGGVDAVGRSESGNDDAFPSSKEVPETTDASTPEAPSPAKNLFELQQVCLRKSFKKDGIPLPIEEVLDVWELPDVCAIRADCPAVVSSLMRQCWNVIATERPIFLAVSTLLSELEASENNKQRRLTMESAASAVATANATLHRSYTADNASLLASGLHEAGSQSLIDADAANWAMGESGTRSFGYSRDWGTQEINHLFGAHNAKGGSLAHGQKVLGVGSVYTKARKPTCWARMWNLCGLHYASNELETRFILQRLRNDEYYKGTKWMLLLIATINAAFVITMAMSFVRTPEDTIHAPGTWYIMYTGLGHPFLMMLLFGSCALAGWVKVLRRYMSFIVMPQILLVTIMSFIVYPILESDTESAWVAQNLTFPTYDGDTMLAYAPLDSAFIYGDLLGANNSLTVFAADGRTVCAGQGLTDSTRIQYPTVGPPQLVNETVAVRACSSFYFQFGLGSLKWSHSWGLLLLNCVTVPVLLMFLALPLRLYLLSLVVPLIGAVLGLVNVYYDDMYYVDALQQKMDSNHLLHFEFFANEDSVGNSAQRISGYALLLLAIFVSCSVSAASHERYHRSLFTVHLAMREKRSTLLESADVNRYRYIMKRNRDRLARR